MYLIQFTHKSPKCIFLEYAWFGNISCHPTLGLYDPEGTQKAPPVTTARHGSSPGFQSQRWMGRGVEQSVQVRVRVVGPVGVQVVIIGFATLLRSTFFLFITVPY